MKNCKYYCKDYQLEGMCKKHSDWSEIMPIVQYCPNSLCKDYEENEYITLKGANGKEYIVSKEKIMVTDPYDNIMITYSDGAVCYRQNAPTYDELYEHWLKTKGKPKQKCKSKQLPGQLDMFDTIDNTIKEQNND